MLIMPLKINSFPATIFFWITSLCCDCKQYYYGWKLFSNSRSRGRRQDFHCRIKWWRRTRPPDNKAVCFHILCCSTMQNVARFRPTAATQSALPTQTPFTSKVMISSWSKHDKDLNDPAESSPGLSSHTGPAANHHREAWPTFCDVGQGHNAHLWPTRAGWAQEKMLSSSELDTFTRRHTIAGRSSFTFCGTTSCASGKQKTGSRWKDCNQLGTLSLLPSAGTSSSRHSAKPLFCDAREHSASF